MFWAGVQDQATNKIDYTASEFKTAKRYYIPLRFDAPVSDVQNPPNNSFIINVSAPNKR